MVHHFSAPNFSVFLSSVSKSAVDQFQPQRNVARLSTAIEE
jgi:hypothetical protein